MEIAIVLPPEVYVVGMWFATGHAVLALHGASESAFMQSR